MRLWKVPRAAAAVAPHLPPSCSVLGGWVVLLIATFALSSVLHGAFKTEFKLPGTESQAAFDLLEKSSFRNRQVQAQIVFAAKQDVHDARVRQAMERLFKQIEDTIPHVEVASPYGTEGARQVSRNGKVAYAQLNFADRSGEQFTDDGKKIERFASGIPVVDVKVGGLTAAADDLAAYTAARLPIFMGAVLLLSFLLLMIVFRSLLLTTRGRQARAPSMARHTRSGVSGMSR